MSVLSGGVMLDSCHIGATLASSLMLTFVEHSFPSSYDEDLFEELDSLLDYGVNALRDPAEIQAYTSNAEEGKRIFRASGLDALKAFAYEKLKTSRAAGG
jgi:hypothetical protein